ncbi:MAG TPA: hypothetical protein VK433_08910 [Stellaceae bacterium]|nr:hypothetical protein [Stellaceae bacterium]
MIEFSFMEGQPPNRTDVKVTVDPDSKNKRKLKIKVRHKKKDGMGDDTFEIGNAVLVPAPPVGKPPPEPPKPRETMLKGDGGSITVTCPQDDNDTLNRPKINLGPGSGLIDAPITEKKQTEIIDALKELKLPEK